MPSALHPQAKFDPIPPDLDLSVLVESTPNFDYVVRIAAEQIHELGLEQFEKLVLLHVIVGGKPLVVEGWGQNLPPWLFSQTWLEDNVGKKHEKVRDIVNAVDIPMTIGHYLGAMEKLTRQWTPTNYRDSKRQRLYLKDIDCPEQWRQHLQNIIPQTLFYLNDCVGEQGGPGALQERNNYNQLVLGKGVGPAGDLMSNLPIEMQAENMMCYIGHEGTYTPAHREMCASLGQNIMVETSETEKGEKAGSSIWFMTESKDREVVSEYFLSMLGHDIEVESHFAQINAWKKAPFPVYIINQKVGDFILVPPLAPHQVWNRGTRTMKVAWNRTTVETLELALHEAIPRARMVCRDEQYKNKAIIYYSLLRYYEQLKRVEQAEDVSWDGKVKDFIKNSIRVRQLRKDFKRLFALYTEILISEMFSKDLPKEKRVEYLPFDSNVTCSYCRCNIFNRFLTCKSCIGEAESTEDEDTYDICMECYAMGRSCGCISNLTWVEQWQWHVLTRHYEEWRAMVIANDGFYDSTTSQQTLELARSLYGKKPVAQVCQEQLKLRPWRDISKPFEPELSPESEPEPEVDDDGRKKKRKGSRRKSQKTQSKRCHICGHKDWNWKLAFCTTCTYAYCYGTLWRAFDIKPQTVMEDPNWQCPKCRNICSCGRCRRDLTQQAYRPKGTLLGHDTRRVADPRSVESLVDFSRTNLTWLRGEGDGDPHTSLRMQKLVEKAQTEKAREESLEEEILSEQVVGENDGHTPLNVNSTNDMAIDPQLRNYVSETSDDVDDVMDTDLIDKPTVACTQQALHSGHHSSSPNEGLRATVKDRFVPPHQGRKNSSTSLNSQSRTTTENENTIVTESPYMDPSVPGLERMMGMGYYQQANDIDKILFDHPYPSVPDEPEFDITYPRLPEAPPDLKSSHRKGNLANSSSNKSEIESAHLQYLQAQKKQKLADARRRGRYYMTLNQLEGGRKLVARLRMTDSKEFLRNLRRLDEGQKDPRYNPRSPRRSVAKQLVLGQDGGPAITETGKDEETATSIYHEDSNNQDDGTLLAMAAVRKVTIPSEVELSGGVEGHKNGRQQKPLFEHGGSSLEIDDTSHVPQAVSSPIQRQQVDLPLNKSTKRKLEDQPQTLQPSTGDLEESPHFAALETCKPSTYLETVPIKRNNMAIVRKNDNIVVVAPTKQPSRFSKTTVRIEDKNMSSNFQHSQPATKASANLPVSSKSKPLSEDYLKAKEEAFRMFEEEEAARIASKKVTPAKIYTSAQINVAGNVSKSLISKVQKTNPKGLPWELMSMAERQALKGKPFKIVPARSNAVHGVKTNSTNATSTSTAKPAQSFGYRFSSEESDQGDLSSDSDDESIPAVRPIAQKNRVEALTDRQGKNRISIKSEPGMLDSVFKARRPVRMIK